MSSADLIEKARQGDRSALGRLLLLCDQGLRRRLAAGIPSDLQGVLAVEDVLQETYLQAYRSIAGFQPQGPHAFQRWLVTIAENKLIDLIRAHHAAKRPPPARGHGPDADRSSSLLSLSRLVDGQAKTPSGVLARREALRALEVALAGLPEPIRQAVWGQHIEGKSAAEIAAAMGRTERAVNQLCYRGMLLLRECMGNRSQYLSRSG